MNAIKKQLPLSGGVALTAYKNPVARDIASCFDVDGSGKVDKSEAPAAVLELAKKRGPIGAKNRPWGVSTEPIAQRLARGAYAKEVAAVAAKKIDKALAARIDHTLLTPGATSRQIEQLCKEAVLYGFRAVCVIPELAGLAAQLVKGSSVKVACVVGFPSGTSDSIFKAEEARRAIQSGANEIDMVANTTHLAEAQRDPRYYANYFEDVRLVAEYAKAPVKVILQTGLIREAAKSIDPQNAKALGDEMLKSASAIATTALLRANPGAQHFIKTCTGVWSKEGGATLEDVAIMKAAAKGKVQIKASGGVRTSDDAKKLSAAGADIFGTSGGISIVSGSASTAVY